MEEIQKEKSEKEQRVRKITHLYYSRNDIQKAIFDEKINGSQARIIAGLPDEKLQMQMFKKMLAGVMNVRQAESESKRIAGKPTTHEKDANLAAKEEIIRFALGTKAEIKHQGKKGQIIINFYSDEELEGIIRRLAEL